MSRNINQKIKGYNECKVCQTNFPYYNGTDKRNLFCSAKCKNYYYNRNSKGKKNCCIDCGKPINLNSQRCKECALKNRDLSGSKNGRWKGGVSEGYQIKIYKGVLEDNGVNTKVCAKCGKPEDQVKRIEIHHIDGNHQNNKFSNLQALCTKCHHHIHNSNKNKVNCAYCNKEIWRTPSNIKTRQRMYCSKNCLNKHKSILYTGRKRLK